MTHPLPNPSRLHTRILTRLRYEISMRGFDLRRSLGGGTTALRPRPVRRIVIYHGLDRRGGSGFNTRFISVERFAEQVSWWAANAHVVSLADYAAGARDPDRPTVCLTFDDGYASWLELALPILERHHVPAAFFVTAIRAAGETTLWPDRLDIACHLHRVPVVVRGETFTPSRSGHRSARGVLLKTHCRQRDAAYIRDALAAFPAHDLPDALAHYWRHLDESGVRQLAASPLVTIGAHGVRHLSLACQPPAVVDAELAGSKAWLEAVVQRPVMAFAFPDDSWNDAVLEAAESAGYRILLGGAQEGGHPLRHPRFTLNPYISWDNQVRCLYAGSYS